MAKTVTVGKYLKYIYNLFKVRIIDTSSVVMCPKTTVYVNYDMKDSRCFCYPTKPGVARITLGALFYKEHLGLPESITPEFVDEHGSEYVKLLKGTYYHELAHIMYSPLDSKLISEYKHP